VTERELALLAIGIAIGIAGSVFVVSLRRALALRDGQHKHEHDLAQRRARQLKTRAHEATGKDGLDLDLEAVYSGLLSENGFEGESMEDSPLEPESPLEKEEKVIGPDRQDPVPKAPGRAAYDLET
jgi:hypothetical protein